MSAGYQNTIGFGGLARHVSSTCKCSVPVYSFCLAGGSRPLQLPRPPEHRLMSVCFGTVNPRLMSLSTKRQELEWLFEHMQMLFDG